LSHFPSRSFPPQKTRRRPHNPVSELEAHADIGIAPVSGDAAFDAAKERYRAIIAATVPA
jgi:hypothetical protein